MPLLKSRNEAFVSPVLASMVKYMGTVLGSLEIPNGSSLDFKCGK